MSSEEVEQYEAELELALYREYRDVISVFKYVVETPRRSYLANEVRRVSEPGSKITEYELIDAWVWDMYRTSRFVSSVTITSVAGLTIEHLPERDI